MQERTTGTGAGSHTPGPWRWEVNPRHHRVQLVGGRPQFDLTVMDFNRWGMGSAAPRFRDPDADGLNLMSRLPDQSAWLAPFPGREHHAAWLLDVTHPDARLIAAAPDLLDACEAAADWLDEFERITSTVWPGKDALMERLRAAVEKARGRA